MYCSIIINEKIITDILIGSEFQNIILENIKLKPGKNMIMLDTDEHETWASHFRNGSRVWERRQNTKVSERRSFSSYQGPKNLGESHVRCY